ncbi:hypothetical protein [Clostridium sediminicola]
MHEEKPNWIPSIILESIIEKLDGNRYECKSEQMHTKETPMTNGMDV